MLARRLLILALVLLVVTTLSTALAPPRAPVPDAGPSPTVSEGAGPAVIEHTVEAGADAPEEFALAEGDRLRLTVESDEAGAVELRGLAQLKAIAPDTPAVFDVLPSAGEYPVIFDGVRTVATVRVTSGE